MNCADTLQAARMGLLAYRIVMIVLTVEEAVALEETPEAEAEGE